MNEAHQIGIVLRGAREVRELSIPDVTHLTRIQATIIQALEEGDYASFSSLAYAKSFLHQYSEFLGVDAHGALAAFAPPDPLFNLEAYEYLKPHSERVRSKQPPPEPEPEVPQGPNLAAISIQAMALILIAAVIVGAVIYTVKTVETRGAPSAFAAIKALQRSAGELQDKDATAAPENHSSVDLAAMTASNNSTDPVESIVGGAPRAIIVREP
jgi:cytoskeletal protein RodZ